MLISEQLKELVEICLVILQEKNLSKKECQYIIYRKLLKLGFTNEIPEMERGIDDE